MDREQQRKEISLKICERCDHFDGRACTVNVTGECNLAKDSAESILAIGYGYAPVEILIDGQYYTLKQLQRYINFYDEHQIKAGQTTCPLCGSEYAENGLFICDCCGNLLNTDEMCKEHNWDGNEDVCQECCSFGQHERAFEDAVNHKIDIMRGK